MKVRFLTAERMLQIEAASIVDGDVDVDGNLILTTHGGVAINAGLVRGLPGKDGNNVDAKAYSDAGDATTLASAKTYSDGRLVAAKAYSDSLHIVTELDAAVDLNTVFKTGYYIQSQLGEATLGLHYPKAAAGFLEVFGDGVAFVFQRYIVQGGSTFTRTYSGGTWQSWLMIARPASTTDVASGYTNNFVSANGIGDNVTIFQRNGSCHIRGRVRQTAGFTGGKVLDIPAGLKPAFDTSPRPVYAGNGGNSPGPYLWATVSATGGLVISKGNNAATPAWDSSTWITVDLPYISEEA